MVAHQPESYRHLPWLLLLRLLLVPVCHLAAGLPGDGAALHHPARRLLLLATLFCVWSQRTTGWLDRRPVDGSRLGPNAYPQGNCHRSVSYRLIADSRVPSAEREHRHLAAGRCFAGWTGNRAPVGDSAVLLPP